MLLGRVLIPGALVFAAACSHEQPIPEAVRSDSRSINLPSDPVRLAAELAVPVDSLRAAGEERYGRQAYDSARAIWQVALARAQKVNDSAAEARVRMWLGLAAWRLGDYSAAIKEGETSLAMKRRLKLDAELSRSFNALGLLAWNEGRHRDALISFDSAIAAARRNSDAAGVARAAANIPLVKIELGDFEGARRGFENAVTAGRAVDDDRIQGNALANLAMLEIRLGNPAKSLPLLSQARAHYAKIEYATGEANALGQLATAWSGLGDLQRAISEADSALTIARSVGLEQEVASILEVIADLHVQAGNLRFALQYLHEADSLDKALGLAVERGTNLRRTAGILLELGELHAAIARLKEAIVAHQQVEAKGEEVYDRIQLARALSRKRDPGAAASEAEAGLRLATTIGSPPAVSDATAASARVALDAGKPADALALLTRLSKGSLSVDWRVSDLRAEAFQSLGRLENARREAEKAVAGLERERSSLGSGELRSEYFENKVAPISRLVAIDLAQHDTAEAFRVAASLPGRSLAEHLAEFTNAAVVTRNLAESELLLVRASALESQIAALDSKAEEQRAALERELQKTRSEYEAQLARRSPVPRGKMLGQLRPSLRDVQSQLTRDEAMVSFLVGPDATDVFIVTRAFVYHDRFLITDRGLAARVRIVREALGMSVAGVRVPRSLGEMHDLLFGKAATAGVLRNISHLIIVPHGPLGALPFAALWNQRSGQFLVQQFTIGYLPAVGAIGALTHGRRASGSRAFVFAPVPDSLPGTAAEARAVSRLLPNSVIRVGADATEADVRSALRFGALVHIASHGSHNIQNPMFSRVIVARGRHIDSKNDGRLEVHEILALSTSSPLVFLSGCETGLGSGADGPFATTDEGSLAQAFLFAGVRTVVATLWRVTDKRAATIAEAFYRNLQHTAGPEEALAFSQREAINRRTDLGWAAYIISGTQHLKSAP